MNIEEQEISQENTLHHKEMEISSLKEKIKELKDDVINKNLIIENMAICMKENMPLYHTICKYKGCIVDNCINCIINHFSEK